MDPYTSGSTPPYPIHPIPIPLNVPVPPLQFSPPISQTFDPYTQSFLPVHVQSIAQNPFQSHQFSSDSVPVQQHLKQPPSPNLESVLRAFETGRIPTEMIVRYAESIGAIFTNEMFLAGIQFIRENPSEFEPIYEKLVREGLFERYPVPECLPKHSSKLMTE